MEKNELDFMEANIGNYDTIINGGYVRNIPIEILNKYDELYRKYLNPTHYMCKYCKEDIFRTLEQLYRYYLSLPQEQVQYVQEPVQETKKRGRPKK